MSRLPLPVYLALAFTAGAGAVRFIPTAWACIAVSPMPDSTLSYVFGGTSSPPDDARWAASATLLPEEHRLEFSDGTSMDYAP